MRWNEIKWTAILVILKALFYLVFIILNGLRGEVKSLLIIDLHMTILSFVSFFHFLNFSNLKKNHSTNIVVVKKGRVFLLPLISSFKLFIYYIKYIINVKVKIIRYYSIIIYSEISFIKVA